MRRTLFVIIIILVLVMMTRHFIAYETDVEYSWNNLTRTTEIQTYSTNVVVATERPVAIAQTYGSGELILSELSEVVTVVLYPHEGVIEYYVKGKTRHILATAQIPSFEKPVEGVQIEGIQITMKSGSSKGMVEVTFKKSLQEVVIGVVGIFIKWLIVGGILSYTVHKKIMIIRSMISPPSPTPRWSL